MARKQKNYGSLTKDQQHLVSEHMWIAERLAYKATTLTNGHTGACKREDLVSVGYFALCVAATRYTTDRGVKFSTYAWTTVNGYISHELRDRSRVVRIPRWVPMMREEIKALRIKGYTYEQIKQELDVSDEELALCELSWGEIHLPLDHEDEDSPFPTLTAVFDGDNWSAELLQRIADFPDADVELAVACLMDGISIEDMPEKPRAIVKSVLTL